MFFWRLSRTAHSLLSSHHKFHSFLAIARCRSKILQQLQDNNSSNCFCLLTSSFGLYWLKRKIKPTWEWECCTKLWEKWAALHAFNSYSKADNSLILSLQQFLGHHFPYNKSHVWPKSLHSCGWFDTCHVQMCRKCLGNYQLEHR